MAKKPFTDRQFSSRRRLCGETCHVAEAPDDRHASQGVEVAEPVAFGVIGLPVDQGGDQGRQICGVHLSVAVDLDDDLRLQLESLFETRDHRAAHPLVGRMSDEQDAAVAFGGLRDRLAVASGEASSTTMMCLR
jgi:hypothetical protein